MINKYEFEVTTNLETQVRTLYVGGVDALTTRSVFEDYILKHLSVDVVNPNTGEVIPVEGFTLIGFPFNDYVLMHAETGEEVTVTVYSITPVDKVESGERVFYTNESFTNEDIANALFGIANGDIEGYTQMDFEAMANILKDRPNSDSESPTGTIPYTLIEPYVIEE